MFKRQIKLKSDTVNYKKRTANKIAVKRLANAKKILQNNDSNAFFEEVFTALYGYMEDKFSIPKSQLSKQTIIDHLNQKGVNQKLITDFITTIENCEMARFSPVNNENMQQTYDKSVHIISSLENKG